MAHSDQNGGRARRRAGTAFGWVAGAAAGLLASYGVFLVAADAVPPVVVTFVLVVAGCFGGMRLADRLGGRAFRVLGLAAGILLAAALTLAAAVLLSGGAEG